VQVLEHFWPGLRNLRPCLKLYWRHSTPQIRAAAMVLLATVRNLATRGWGGLKCHKLRFELNIKGKMARLVGSIAGSITYFNGKGISVTFNQLIHFVCLFVCFWRDSPQWARASSFTRILDHTQWRITVGRTPLDEWSSVQTSTWHHITLKTDKISLPPVGSEPTISADERPQTNALDRAATGTGNQLIHMALN